MTQIRGESEGVPRVDVLEEPLLLVTECGEIVWANRAFESWYPRAASEGSIVPAVPTWNARVPRRVARYGRWRSELWREREGETSLPVVALVTARDEGLLVCIRDRSREVETELLIQSHAAMIDRSNYELQRERDRIALLFDSLRDAVFCIDAEGQVEGPVSAAARALFGEKLEGASAFDTLFAGVDDAEVAYANLSTVVCTVFGEDELQWELQADLLPVSVVVRDVAGTTRHLSLRYAPVFDRERTVQRILVIAEDRTEARELEARVVAEQARSSRELERLRELAALEPGDAVSFLDEFALTLRQLEHVHVDEAQRLLHTLKGNARSLALAGIATAAHSAEDRILRAEEAERAFDGLHAEAIAYGRLARRVLHVANGCDTSAHERVVHSLRGLSLVWHNPDAADRARLLAVLAQTLEWMGERDAAMAANEAIAAADRELAWSTLLAAVAPVAREAADMRRGPGGPPLSRAIRDVVEANASCDAATHHASVLCQEAGEAHLTDLCIAIASSADSEAIERARRMLAGAARLRERLILAGAAEAAGVADLMESLPSRTRATARLEELCALGSRLAAEVLEYVRAVWSDSSMVPWVSFVLDAIAWSGRSVAGASSSAGLASRTEVVRGVALDHLRGVVARASSGRATFEELVEAALAVDEVSVETEFARLQHVCSDVMRRTGKHVSLRIDARGCALPRALARELYDAALHLVRNAVDHGVESPEERRAAGKPSRATLIVRVQRSDDGVEMVVADDGVGIDVDAVRYAVLDRGVHDAEEIEAMDTEALRSLIFAPGVSTAQAITEISGRGVGLDVVASLARRRDGALSVDSVPGHGSRFRLSLPAAERQPISRAA